MTEKIFRYYLRSILFADLKGDNRMVRDDKIGIYQNLTTNLKSIRSIISTNRGRAFAHQNDSAMAEFANVVEAVACVVKNKKEIKAGISIVPKMGNSFMYQG